VSRNIHAQLDGPRQIHTENILRVPVVFQLLDGLRALVLYSAHAPTQGLNFLLN
jgi:hypothetical protein